tara:strand:+ start:76 stop:399 length:324 start_codon:yes stop_codon:yes gene_type:complete
MNKHGSMPFYEYYFEPAGKTGMVIVQFMHYDYNDGMKAKKHIELMFNYCQFMFMFLLIFSLIVLYYNKIIGVIILIAILTLFSTRFLNPFGVQYQQWKASTQQLFSF